MKKEQEKREHNNFKKNGFLLILLRRKADKLFEEGKMSKKKNKEIKEKIKYLWHKAYNRHPNVSSLIKQGFNFLYT